MRESFGNGGLEGEQVNDDYVMHILDLQVVYKPLQTLSLSHTRILIVSSTSKRVLF